MDPWSCFDIRHSRMEGFIKMGLLHAGSGDEWIILSNEDEPMVPDGYVVSFVHFHKCGLVSPPTDSSAGFFITVGLSSSI
jgi:hypothetical protein